MLALAATFVGFSAFKAASRHQAESGWYTITVDPLDPDNQEHQQIEAFEGTAPPTGNCSTLNNQDPCQAELDLTNFNSSTPIDELTVAEAIAAGASSSVQYARRNQ
ncbi:hypothetical protein SAMN05421740_102755 [Parapedobacter koreensis]|uniref:Uncharacterized protein n=2 Tax=Parapedobacter koreensis TaxID=332977 RepID=A0A1H7K4M1_9SPHI|nr:hypothetical protein SAMN05421740_102755 [Parapedobacter koreensis]